MRKNSTFCFRSTILVSSLRYLYRPRGSARAQEPRDIAANLMDSYQQLWREPFGGASSAPKKLDLPRSGKNDLGGIVPKLCGSSDEDPRLQLYIAVGCGLI